MSGVYLHLVLSHIPVIGVLIGIVSLLWGMICRNNGVVEASLMLFVAMAAAAAIAASGGR